MNLKLITIEAIAVVILAVVYFAGFQADSGPAELPLSGEETLIGNFPVDRVETITLRAFDDTDPVEKRVRIRRIQIGEGDQAAETDWVVTSRYGYAADKEKVRDLFKEIRELKSGPVRGENPELLERFELDEKQETEITFQDDAGNEILSLHFGKTNISMANLLKPSMGEKKDESTTYVRLGDDPAVYEIPGSHSFTADHDQWLDLDILKEDKEKIEGVRLVGEHGEIALVRKEKEDEQKEGEDGDGDGKGKDKEKKPAYEWFLVKTVPGRGEVLVKAKKWAAQNLVRNIASLTGDGVAEPIEPLEDGSLPPEALKRYGFDAPALEIEAYIDQERRNLVFGKVVEKDAEKPTYYVYSPRKRSAFRNFVETMGLGGEQTTTVEKIHVYTVREYTFKNLNKKPRELKEEAPEAKDALLKGVHWDEIEGFDIRRGEKEGIRVRKCVSEYAIASFGTEIWASADHWNAPVVTGKVEAFLKEMKGLKLGDTTVPGADPAEMGLDEAPRTVVTLYETGAKKAAELFVGSVKKLDGKEITFMALPGQDPREVPGSHGVSPDPSSWLDLRLFDFQMDELKGYRIHSRLHGEVTLVKARDMNGNTRWTLGKRVPGRRGLELHPARQEEAANIATFLSSLSASGLESPVTIPPKEREVPKSRLRPYGLHDPFLTVTVFFDQRSPNMIHVGKKAPDAETYYAVIPVVRQMDIFGGGGDYAFKVRVWRMNTYVIDALLKGEDHFNPDARKKEGEEEKAGDEENGGSGGQAEDGAEEKGDETPGKQPAGEGDEEAPDKQPAGEGDEEAPGKPGDGSPEKPAGGSSEKAAGEDGEEPASGGSGSGS